MKKLISFVLALSFAVALPVAAFADTPDSDDRSLFGGISDWLSGFNAPSMIAEKPTFEKHYSKTITADDGYLLNIDSVTLNGCYWCSDYDKYDLCTLSFPGQNGGVSVVFSTPDGDGSLYAPLADPLYWVSDNIKDTIVFNDSGVILTRKVSYNLLPFSAMNNREDYAGWRGLGIFKTLLGDLPANYNQSLELGIPVLSSFRYYLGYNNQGSDSVLFLGNTEILQSVFKSQCADRSLQLLLPVKSALNSSVSSTGTLPKGIKTVTFSAECPIDVNYTQVPEPAGAGIGNSINGNFGSGVGNVSGAIDSSLDGLKGVSFGDFGSFVAGALRAVPFEIWLAFTLSIIFIILRIALRIMSG